MKIKTLCAAALVATIGLTVIGGTAFADEHALKGSGKVEFKDNTSSNGKLDPEEPGKEVDPVIPGEVTENGDSGAITMDRVANLNFGIHEIDVTPTDKTYEASDIEVIQKDKDGSNARKTRRGPWVQWTDKRAGTNHKYEIKVAMTKQFANGAETLQGATVEYTNGLLNSEQPLNNWPAKDVLNSVVKEDGEKATVFDNMASTDSVGIGTWSAEFGQSADYQDDNARGDKAKGASDKSVILTVPGGQSILKGQYNAEFTWTIEYTP